MKSERMDLRFRIERTKEALAWEKVRNYDTEQYKSMNDYVIHAINAYEEPVPVLPEKLKSELRDLIQEEICKESFL